MKRRRMFLTMMTLLLLLISVSAWAMLPEDGIYEKKDERTSPGAPIIALQALDGSGNVTEELATCYIWKTDTAGAGETGLRLRGETLQNAMKQYSKFTPEVFSTSFGQQVEFGFVNEGEANAYNCSDALNGKYVKKADATEYYPVSALLYAYKNVKSQCVSE